MKKNLSLLRLGLLLLATCCFPLLAQSQNTYCVRAGATGANNGSDWNNAYTSLPSTLQRGATYYVAAGTYGSYRFDDPPSGTTVTTIKKATAAEHKTDVGWNAAYGDGQAVWNGPLYFDSNYWIFDGVTRDEADWFSGSDYGFKIFHNNQEQQIRISTSGTAVSYVQIRNTYLQALNTALPSQTIRRYGLDIDTFGGSGTSRGLVVSRCFFQYGNVPIFTRANDGMILEYSAFDASASNGANHGEAMSAYYTNHRLVIRFNKFRDVSGTAVIAFTTGSTQPIDGFEIYGNVVWNCDVGDGVFGFDRTEWPFSNTKIYNNTIVDKAGGFNHGIAIRTGNNNVVYNNLWVNCQSSFWNGGGATYSHNAYSWNYSEPNAQINVPTSIFVNYGADDFRLASATTAGSPLGASFNNLDLSGRLRGSDGVWDRGAYEYGGVADTTPPVLSGINANSVTAIGAVIVWTTDEVANSVVEYGPTTAYGSTATSLSLVLAHTVTLGNLSPSTLYHYRVLSTDAAGNTRTSGDFTFSTGILDSAPPAVALTAPANGSTVSNTVNLSATASDNVGVAGVRFFVNGTQVSDDTTSPYAYSWDSRFGTNGTYRISAQARDAMGNTTSSATNLVTVNNPPVALPAPAVYWSFNEGSGSTASDMVGNNTLTLRNGATLATVGKFAGGMQLDGVNDRADAANSSALNITGNAISVSAWVKLENQGTWQQIMVKVKETGAFTPPYFAWHMFGGHASATQWTPNFQVVNSSETSVNVGSSVTVNYGEWVHLAGIYDGSQVRLYVNGVERGNAPLTGNIISYTQPLYVGAHGQPAEFSKGTIDEVRIFSQALSPAQVQGLFVNEAPLPPSGLQIIAEF